MRTRVTITIAHSVFFSQICFTGKILKKTYQPSEFSRKDNMLSEKFLKPFFLQTLQFLSRRGPKVWVLENLTMRSSNTLLGKVFCDSDFRYRDIKLLWHYFGPKMTKCQEEI